jgi:hypothetical protein
MRRRLKIRLVWLILLLISMGMVVFGYALPRFTGDQFANQLIRLNIVDAKTFLCPETSLGQVAALLGGDNSLGTFLADQLQRRIQLPGWLDLVSRLRIESSYNPLSGMYTVAYALEDQINIVGFQIQGGVRTPTMTLGVRRLSPFLFCLSVM